MFLGLKQDFSANEIPIFLLFSAEWHNCLQEHFQEIFWKNYNLYFISSIAIFFINKTSIVHYWHGGIHCYFNNIILIK